MLDLNYVRENLEKVRSALAMRGLAPESLDDFVAADAERRRVIAESDQLNAERNASSREIRVVGRENAGHVDVAQPEATCFQQPDQLPFMEVE